MQPDSINPNTQRRKVEKFSKKFPRIVRLDDSDTQTYEVAATPGEWAVVGTFHFWDANLENLSGKARQAFVHGFLGSDSFGWGTLVVISEISAAELEALSLRLATHLVDQFGAPNIEAALPAAHEEIAFSKELCTHNINTLLAIQREYVGQEITETFKVIHPPNAAEHDYLQLWGIDHQDGK